MMLHLTKKNAWIWTAGVCVVFIGALGLLVPQDQWGLPAWKWLVLALLAMALVGLTVTLFSQSKEDTEREERERKRDETQQAVMAQLAALSIRGNEKSLTVMTTTQDIQPLTPPVDFDAAHYFKLAYHSLLTADVEKRIKIAASQAKAHYTMEEFYSKFIGVGLVSYFHDITWAYIWKSQFLMLAELNRQGGMMPISVAKSFYDQGAKDYPNNYLHYTFDQWITFMVTQGLVIRHPSEMLEITVRGRDFLSYSAHTSRNPDQRSG
jgi:hypothetical protein